MSLLNLRRPLILASLILILPVVLVIYFLGHTNTGQAVSSSGPLYVWGYNNYGQVGNGSNIIASTPVLINLPNGAIATVVGGGQSYSMAASSDGKLYAWGRNNFGQLGDGTYNNSSTPVAVNFPAGVAATTLSGGQGHTLAIGSDNKLYAWGYNISGQLGNGTNIDNITPNPVNLATGVTAVQALAGYNQSMALGSDGKFYMWGYNGYGQLGNGTYNETNTPTVLSVASGVSVTAMAGRGFHTMVIGSDNKLYTWGRNDYGQLGNGTNTQSNTPGVISLGSGVTPVAISGGYYHSLAIGSDGKIYTWGRNDSGQLGNGTNTQSSTPVAITLPGGVTPVAIATGIYHSLALGNNGKLYAWGVNSEGELGIGSITSQSNVPVLVKLPAGATITSFSGSGYIGMAILNPPTLSVNNVSLAEGNSGTTNFNFTVSLDYATSATVTVTYSTAPASATAPADYTATSGTLTFAPGTITQTITVPVVGDTTYEPDETFTVNLSSPVGAAITTAQGTGTIVNDDTLSTTIGLGSSPNPSNVGQSVTFTATVLPAAASGTVTFTEGATTLGTGTLTNGIATFTTTSLIAGSHVISATYAGSFPYAASSSAAIIQVVNLNPTTLSLSSSTNPSNVGQSVTFTATVSAPDATGTANFSFDGGSAIPIAVSGGKATYVTTTLAVGNHTVNAAYTGNATYASSSASPINQVVNLNNTTLGLASAPNPSYVGQSVTFTATVSPLAASGTVTFTEGATTLGTGTLTNGIATFTTTNLIAGSHAISATYAGNTAYAGSSSAAITQVVNLNPTTLNLTSSANPSTVGQWVTFTATVSPPAATGLVSFSFDNGTAINIVIIGGKAIYDTNTLPAGVHLVTATYNGSATYAGSSASPINQLVNLNNSSLTLSSTPNPSSFGQTVIFTATVSPATASGTVTFTEGTTTLGTGTLTNGIATFTTTNLSVGNHTVGAAYGGNSSYAGTNSNTVQQVVNKATTDVALISSLASTVFGQSVTFTATVSPGAASGTVTFTEGITTLGTGAVNSGVATFTTSTLPVGSHTIKATYGGDTNYAASNSNTVTQTVYANCDPLVVTNIHDNGTANTCGTFSHALLQASSGMTISFALTTGNTITFTGSLTPTVKSGVTIDGSNVPGNIVLYGNGVAGDGLRLEGRVTLINLTIRNFAERELVTLEAGNILKRSLILQT